MACHSFSSFVIREMWWQHHFGKQRKKLKLLWAKNRPVKDADQLQYINELLLENAQNGTSTNKLLEIVIRMCREKKSFIESRS